MQAWDRAAVLALNRVLDYPACALAARCVSRLGDGEMWGALVLLLYLLPDAQARACALQLAVASLGGLFVYKLIKHGTGRPRPCVCLHGLHLCARPLDEYSFPSGHVLHAVAFAVIVPAHFPAMAVLLVPFALLTALVRVVLGLHYPSDVIAGMAVGAGVASLSLAAIPPM